VLVAAACLVVLLAVVDGARAHAGGAVLPHVTLIGDSVVDAIPGDSAASRTINQGIDLNLVVDPCRRLEDPSCPPNPPTTIDVIHTLGASIGPNVVIAVGYNDFEDHYAAEIEDTLNALEAVGVKKVFWLTLRAAHHGYLTMNDDINAAAAKHTEVSVIDWNVYSRSHPEWFQVDGIHLLAGGSEAMATLIHQRLLATGVALPPVRVTTAALPKAQRGKPYRAALTATGGAGGPYTWSLAGRMPAGLRLRANGKIAGTARSVTGVYTFVVRAKDGAGETGTRKLLLHVR
jgi:hypothetical protein